MGSGDILSVEKIFQSLPHEEREAIIRYGVAFRLAELQKRLFLAESKERYFEEKYGTTLDQLEAQGLPDDAGVEMHEEYLMWRHWRQAASKAKEYISAIQEIAQGGIPAEELHAGG